MSKELELGIPKPCTENWSNMSPETNGRFCGACQKTVLDFTAMEDNEILQWFAAHRGSTCGRFRPDQLNRPMITTRENKTHWRYWHYLIAGLLFSSEVSAQTKPAAPPTSQHDNNILLGKIKAMPEPKNFTDSIRGRVVDANANSVVYATIKYDNAHGVVTDDYGYFSISLSKVSPQATLYITAVGYKSDSIAVAKFLAANQPNLIVLKMEANILGDVVVVGGVQKKHKPKVDTISIIKDTLVAIGLLPKPLTIYPNPVAKGNQITVSARLDETGTYTIQLFSISGILMQTTQVNGAPKTPKLSVTIPANLTPGTYIVRVSHPALTRSYSEEVVVF
jgi:CarboxypepD_reg-like domain/Secretion system C-terminal sorting domain